MKATVKMTMLVFLAMAISCSPETTIDTEPDGAENLKMVAAKGKKAKPIKAKLFNFPDPNEQDPLLCNPEQFGFPLTRNIINGNMSHLGKLQPGISDEATGEPISGSFGVPVSCDINLETFRELVTIYEVTYVAANGDEFVTMEPVTISFPNDTLDDEGNTIIDYGSGNFTNTLDANGDPMPILIVSGTGRFDGATGELYFVDASFGPEGTFWELVGEIIY